MTVINFTAFLGSYYQNRSLLIMYVTCLATSMLIFASVAIACFVYANVPAAAELGNAAFDSALNTSDTSQESLELIRKAIQALGAACLISVFLSMFPLTLAANLIRRLGKTQEEKQRPHQLRVVLKVAQLVSMAAAVVMACYGANSLQFLFRIGFSATAFPIYLLMYGGVNVFIVAVGVSSLLSIRVSRDFCSVLFHYYRTTFQQIFIFNPV
jgi:hypothetical protein